MAEIQSAFRDAEADVFAKPVAQDPMAVREALRDGPSIRMPRAIVDAPELPPGAKPMSPLVYSGLVRFAEFSLAPVSALSSPTAGWTPTSANTRRRFSSRA